MDFLVNFFTDYGYFAVFFILVICGFGVPIPEDITLISGGIISGIGETNPHIMLLVSLVGVLIGDSIMFWLGRYYGVSLIRTRIMQKVLTRKRLHLVREKFKQHGNKMLFIARFLPGLRAAVFLVAGITKRVSSFRFVFIDFLAAIISVPVWIYLGYYGASNRDWLYDQMAKGKLLSFGLLALLIIFILFKFFKYKLNKNK